MKHHRIEAEGIELHALEDGQGDPVVVLHGFTGAAGSMQSVSQALCASHRVIRLELVGHGESASPEDLEAYSMAACARHIVATLDALGLERPALLGYSMGGRAALAAAVAFPDRFASLVLIGATAGIADPALRRARIAADEALAERIEREGVARFVDEWMALPIFVSQTRLGAEELAAARAQRLRNSPRGLAQSLRGMGAGAQPPLYDALPALALPTLLVAGEEDAKFAEIARALESRLPRARTAILAAAGHAAHLEAPQAFAKVVATFLGEAQHDTAEAMRRGRQLA